jgi:hypothetical protein
VPENLGSHSNEGVGGGLLGCDTMWYCRWLPTFWWNMLPVCEIYGFHGGEDDDVLGYGTM